MRLFSFLILALSFSLSYSQPGGVGMKAGRHGGAHEMRKKRPDFDAVKMIGVVAYHDAEVIKVLKLKKEGKDLVYNVRKAISDYNIRIQEILLLNKDNFDTLNVYMNNLMKLHFANRQGGRGHSGAGSRNIESNDENGALLEARGLAREKIEPVKIAVKEEEVKLNDKLELLLSDKKNKKWLKFQEEKKEELNLKKASVAQNNQMRGKMGKQGRSGGGRGNRW